MRLASYLVPSFRRTELLAMSLYCLLGSRVPEGWELEIVVACPPEDEEALRTRGVPSARQLPRISLRFCRGRDGRTDVGSHQTGAMDAARGEIALVTGDDDLQPPQRLREVIRVMDEGASAVGFGRFVFGHVPSGRLTRWRGPAYRAGAACSYRMDVLRRADGWGVVQRGGDHALQMRLAASGYDLRREIASVPEAGAGAVFLCHGTNLSGRRPEPTDALGLGHGPYWLEPAGHYTHAPDLPRRTVTALDWLCGRNRDAGS